MELAMPMSGDASLFSFLACQWQPEAGAQTLPFTPGLAQSSARERALNPLLPESFLHLLPQTVLLI